jgi:hypothetical protein
METRTKLIKHNEPAANASAHILYCVDGIAERFALFVVCPGTYQYQSWKKDIARARSVLEHTIIYPVLWLLSCRLEGQTI